MTEQEKIDTSQRIQRFLEDPFVAGALKRMEEDNYQDFKDAESADEMRIAKARADVLGTFCGHLKGIKEEGSALRTQQEKREQREALERQRREAQKRK